MRRTAPIVVALGLLAAPAAGQLPTDPEIREAFLAWDRGDYDVALQGYLAVLNGGDGVAHAREIAALTGEVFQVTELTPDGSGLVIGPTGMYASYETVQEGRPVSIIYDLREDRVVEVLRGTGVTFGPGGQLAYMHVDITPEILAAQAEADRLRDAGDRAGAQAAAAQARAMIAEATELRTRGVLSGREVSRPMPGWTLSELVYVRGALYGVGVSEGLGPEIVEIRGAGPVVVETLPGPKSGLVPVHAGDQFLVFRVGSGGGRGGRGGFGGRGGGRGGEAAAGIAVLNLSTDEVTLYEGKSSASVSADGSVLAFLGSVDGRTTVEVVTIEASLGEPRVVVESEMALSSPAPSPDGSLVAYQKRPVHDWEIFAVPTDGSGSERQVTMEVQHDLMPQWVDERTILAAKGEGRHRRSFLYRVGEDIQVTKLFHNNTVRTIAPEYAWEVSPDGQKVLIIAERDGDTVSPERGVYLVHLDRLVTADQLIARLERNLTAERDLRARGSAAFMPIQDEVRRVTERADVSRIYQYAAVLYSFDSKHITMPGNRMASDYLEAQLRSWGYEPEIQWFEARGVRTANVIARLPGTVDPELVYVVSSHYDSTQRGPGADDNSSGTTALLEAARLMKDHPQPATIEFAFFTGEEAGLLGSREYVRLAQESGKGIVGALNNDMIGWANNHRLDNTIRYSNPGIRDIQHSAAFLFSDLITYDALYYKSTDAAAYYEAYGDIVGGIGSYPVLGNPHYHQFTDRLETINQRLVTEVSKTTIATLMLLASSPSRVQGLQAIRSGDGVELTWQASPETGVTHYRVEWTGDAGGMGIREIQASERSVRLEDVAPGSEIRVKAVGQRRLEGWDWARVTSPG